MPSQIPPRLLVPVIAACSQLLLKSVSKFFENVEWSISLLRHFKIRTLLKINCCMIAISAFRVTQHRQIFSLFFRNQIQSIALYQLHNSQALLNLRHGYHSTRHLKHDDAFNRTWPPILSIDKCCQVTSLSIERTDHHVLFKASSCLRCLVSSRYLPSSLFYRRTLK